MLTQNAHKNENNKNTINTFLCNCFVKTNVFVSVRPKLALCKKAATTELHWKTSAVGTIPHQPSSNLIDVIFFILGWRGVGGRGHND